MLWLFFRGILPLILKQEMIVEMDKQIPRRKRAQFTAFIGLPVKEDFKKRVERLANDHDLDKAEWMRQVLDLGLDVLEKKLKETA